MQTEYVIQTRQKGAWRRWIGSADRATVDKTWAGLNENGRRGCAVRLVEVPCGKRLKVLATKARVSHDRQR